MANEWNANNSTFNQFPLDLCNKWIVVGDFPASPSTNFQAKFCHLRSETCATVAQVMEVLKLVRIIIRLPATAYA
jgi:hypothetical protein